MRLAILWDPSNPLVPVHRVIKSLEAGTETLHLTFQAVSHRTMPNCSFKIDPIYKSFKPDAVLWVEGGPMPSDLAAIECPKFAWILNSHLEPTLHEYLSEVFSLQLISCRSFVTQEDRKWVPNSIANTDSFTPSPGLHFSGIDPIPPSHAKLLTSIKKGRYADKPHSVPIVICPGIDGAPNPNLLDIMASGGVAVVDEGSDLRDICHVGIHALKITNSAPLHDSLQNICVDTDELRRVVKAAPAIVEHLHQPSHRASQILNYIRPKHKIFSGHTSKPRISILTYCYSFLNRFKFYLESLAQQDLASGSLEIVVTDPNSPDGLVDYLRDFANRHTHLRVLCVPIDETYRYNRGYCISRAFDASSGQIIIATDGDILFPPGLVGQLVDQVVSDDTKVYGVRRIFLTQSETQDIISGRVSDTVDYARFLGENRTAHQESFIGVLGYCQALTRKAFKLAGYPEEFNMVNQSDIVFLERLEAWAKVRPKFLPKLKVLHLWHPRDWSGTKSQL